MMTARRRGAGPWRRRPAAGPGSWGVWASVTPRAAPASVAALTCTASAPAATARWATATGRRASRRPPEALDRVEAAPHRERRAHRRAHGPKHLAAAAGPGSARPAPAVVALVGGRRQEAVDQVAVAGVDLDAVEAGRRRPAGGVGERSIDLGDVVLVGHPVARARRPAR